MTEAMILKRRLYKKKGPGEGINIKREVGRERKIKRNGDILIKRESDLYIHISICVERD